MSRAALTHRLLPAPVLALLLAASPVRAHSEEKTYCEVSSTVGGLDVTVAASLDHLRQLGLSPAGIREALSREVRASTPDGPCAASVEALDVIPSEEGERLRATLSFACPAGAVTLHNGWRLQDPKARSYCQINGESWVFDQARQARLIGESPTLLGVLTQFFVKGTAHMLVGLDHVLFVFALLLAAAATSTERSFRLATLDLLKIVIGFTAGSSLALLAGGLGWVSVPIRWVEASIALSIVVVGVENIVRRRPLARAWLAAFFGLVHGLGFASAQSKLALPLVGTLGALLSFHVGVEVGQLALVLVLFPLLLWASRRPWYRSAVLAPASVMMVAFGALWLVKRAFQLELLPWLGR